MGPRRFLTLKTWFRPLPLALLLTLGPLPPRPARADETGPPGAGGTPQAQPLLRRRGRHPQPTAHRRRPAPLPAAQRLSHDRPTRRRHPVFPDDPRAGGSRRRRHRQPGGQRPGCPEATRGGLRGRPSLAGCHRAAQRRGPPPATAARTPRRRCHPHPQPHALARPATRRRHPPPRDRRGGPRLHRTLPPGRANQRSPGRTRLLRRTRGLLQRGRRGPPFHQRRHHPLRPPLARTPFHPPGAVHHRPSARRRPGQDRRELPLPILE